MLSIPSFRAAHLLPYVHFLRNVGTPVDRLLSRARLPTLFEDNLEAYLPLQPALRFLSLASRLEGIEELGLATTRFVQLSDLNPYFVRAAHASPSLRIALETYCRMGSLENTNVRFWPVYESRQAKLCAFLDASDEPAGLRSAEWSQNMTLVAVVRGFAGSDWYPEEMAFTSDTPVGSDAMSQFPNTHFVLGQKASWITLPRGMLSLPPQVDNNQQRRPGTQQKSREIFEPADFTTSMKTILRPYLADGYPHIELAAEITGTSIRTLQRRLARQGLSYSRLVQHLRYDAAVQLLQNPEIKMIDAANELGWGSPTTFTRAFSQIAGISPSEYRAQFIKGQLLN